jgi:hypothetical protein
MTTELVFFTYVALSLGGICTLSVYDRQRQKRFGPMPSEDRIFRCDKCGFVYTDDADVDRSRCSQCGMLNESIKF